VTRTSKHEEEEKKEDEKPPNTQPVDILKQVGVAQGRSALNNKTTECSNLTIRKSKNMKKAKNQKSLDWAWLTFLMALIAVIELRGANIRLVMVTGDNILTTVNMARDCGTVSHGEDFIRFKAGVVRGESEAKEGEHDR
jgi:hypothetical protein